MLNRFSQTKFQLNLAHSPKNSGTCPVRCPLLFRAIVKRPTLTGPRLPPFMS